jgi:hypothetical protein
LNVYILNITRRPHTQEWQPLAPSKRQRLVQPQPLQPPLYEAARPVYQNATVRGSSERARESHGARRAVSAVDGGHHLGGSGGGVGQPEEDATEAQYTSELRRAFQCAVEYLRHFWGAVREGASGE